MRVVERNRTLSALDSALDAAIAGHGSLTFLAGEAGIGKTTLVRAFADRHRPVTTLIGACDNLSTPTPLGPLHDMAERSKEVAALFGGASPHALFVGFLAHLSTPGRPMIVVLEDVHWADAATLDLLRYVGRRVTRSHAAVVATYRSDDVGAEHPLRALLSDLATAAGVDRHTLAPLSVEGVAALAAGTSLDPVALHDRTGGNPFFVTEVLAHPDVEVPDSLRDVVLARASRLPPTARQVLDVASLVPGAVERDLLEAVLDPAPVDIDHCVRTGLLRDLEPGLLEFRHELGRLAIASAILPARRADLHRRVAGALLRRTTRPSSRIVHHADAAGWGDAVVRHAVIAAEEAAARGAHRQATQQLGRALAHATDLPPADRAGLLVRFADSHGHPAGSSGGEAEIAEAVAIWRDVGDVAALGNALRVQAGLHHLAGRSSAAHHVLAEALAVLEPLGDTPELADALADCAELAMIARDYGRAVALGQRAVAVAERVGHTEALTTALEAIGAVEVLTGRTERGTESMLRSVELARAAGLEDRAVRVIGNLGSGAGEVRRYDIAERHLRAAIDEARQRDLDAWDGYATAWLGRVLFETGRWAEASDVLGTLRFDERSIGPLTRLTGLAVAGRLRSRRGDPGVEDALVPAWELATVTGDLQRLWPVAAARAEAALLGGDHRQVPAIVESSFDLAAELGHPWAIGELGVLLWRADALDRERRSLVERAAAEPFRLLVVGEVAAAAAAWDVIGCPYERAEALADGDEEQQREALVLLDDLGAAPAASLLRHRMRTAGIRSIPRGPRTATAAHPAGLTPRQAEVLELVAEGLTNAEIAEQLFISEKTAGNHVSAILARLGATSRHEAVRLAARAT